MRYQDRAGESIDLMLVVDRLSDQDQERIIRLIHLMRCAPDWLRERTQRSLREFIAQDCRMQDDCAERVEAILVRAELDLEQRLGPSLQQGRSDRVTPRAVDLRSRHFSR